MVLLTEVEILSYDDISQDDIGLSNWDSIKQATRAGVRNPLALALCDRYGCGIHQATMLHSGQLKLLESDFRREPSKFRSIYYRPYKAEGIESEPESLRVLVIRTTKALIDISASSTLVGTLSYA